MLQLRNCLQQSVARSLRGLQSHSWVASGAYWTDLGSQLVQIPCSASGTSSQRQFSPWGCSSACSYSSSSSTRNRASSPAHVWCQGQQHDGGIMQHASSSCKPLQPLQSQIMQLGHQSRYMSSDQSAEQLHPAAQRRKDELMRRLAQHEFRSPTLNATIDPYKGATSLLTSGALPNPIKVARYLYRRVTDYMNVGFALKACENNIPHYSQAALYDWVATLYIRINEAQASYQVDQLQDLVGRDEFLKIRATAEARKLGRWDKIRWELVNKDKLRDTKSKSISLVHARVQKTHEQSPIEWIQLTFRISSEQRFAAYRRQGNKDELVAGNFDEIINVEDYWVFEHKTKTPVDKVKQPVDGAKWRLVKRLVL